MKLTKYMIGGLAALALVGCQDKMRELNTNPDLISSALPEYQFLGATHNWGHFGRGWMTSRAGNIGAAMQVSTVYSVNTPYVNPLEWTGGSMGYMDNYYNRVYESVGGNAKNLGELVKYIDTQLSETEQPRYQDIRAIAQLLQTHEIWWVFTNYGAMPYSEAFKAKEEGIIKPAYDIYSVDIYKQLDEIVKACIAQLSSPMREDAVSLGTHDGFYGCSYTTNPTGGTTWTVNSPEKQRERWLKFATTLRLKMAISMRNVASDYYRSVVNEVRQQVSSNPASFMSEVQDGCQYILPDDSYNRDDGNQISFYYFSTIAFVNSLKQTDDPRLPLLVRANDCDTAMNEGYKFIATYYHDSLLKKRVYNEETEQWEEKSWGDLLTNVFNGISLNTANRDKPNAQPGTLLNYDGWNFIMYHPDYQNPNEPKISADEKAAREAHNATLSSAKMKNYYTGQVEDVVYDGSTENAFQNGVRTVYLGVASGLQGRHYVMNGGNSPSWSGGPHDYDNNQPASSNIKMAIKILPYAEHCFLMSLICNYEGGTIGSYDAEGWYNEGIRASMQETVEDAERVYVKICTNTAYPTIAGVNADADGSNKRLYKIDYNGADYTDYLQKPQVAFTGNPDEKTHKIMTQMWLAMWQKPETTWYYYKVTGYPHTVDYPWEVANQSTALPSTLGFEQPYLNSGEKMIFPRRNQVPLSNVENETNWYDMQSKLLQQTNPQYAPHGWNDYSGRVFWDVVEPAGLAN